MSRPVYLDHHAHSQLDPRVAELLADAFLRFDANPHSTHLAGEESRRAVEDARVHVADLIGVQPAEIIFTSGATEANNMALRGMAAHLAAAGPSRILVSAGEHPSVLEAAANAQDMMVGQIPLTPDGVVDLSQLRRMSEEGTGLVSVAAANHEIGTVQPLSEIAAVAGAGGALLHSDLAQAAGKIPVDVSILDLASLSSHKLGGPGGIGALMVKRRLRRHLRPITVGGGQEAGARPGTVPAPLCVAFGEACRIASAEMDADAVRMARLRDRLLARLRLAGGLDVNGGSARLPGNLNVSFDGVDGEALALRIRDVVSVSTGSACTSASLEPSHVLKAIGLSDRRAEGAIRVGLGRATTESDIDVAADAIVSAVAMLRATLRRVA